MRGEDISQPKLFVTTTVADFVPKHHPLRKLPDAALAELDHHFDGMYSDLGRESAAPGRLIGASMLQVLFTIRSERQLVEKICYNMLYRWFIGQRDRARCFTGYAGGAVRRAAQDRWRRQGF